MNHEEVAKAMEEGIRFAEGLSPEAVEVDEWGHAKALTLARHRIDEASGKLLETEERVTLPARTILVAAGTQPNTVLAREDPVHVALDGRYFQAYDEAGQPVRPERVAKPEAVRVLMSLLPDGRAISFFGDLHPSFTGNVVKAMGGAKQGYPVVSRMLAKLQPRAPAPEELIAQLERRVARRGARGDAADAEHRRGGGAGAQAARAFHPGQFYRLQNYETLRRADRRHDPRDGRARAHRRVGRSRGGLLSTIVLEMGGSSDLCTLLQPGEPVVLMGPTGTPTETPGGETVLLVGGGLGNAVLFSIGQTLRANRSRVLYFAGYKRIADRYKAEEIELAADAVVWCCDEAPGFAPTRPQDRAFVGNIVAAIAAYGSGALGQQPIALVDDRPARRHRLGRDDGGGGARAARGAAALSQAGPPRDRLDQLADAMHDEGDLRAMSPGAEGPGDRRGDGRVLLLQPGPALGPSRFPRAARAARPERGAGKAQQAMGRSLPAPSRPARGRGGGVASASARGNR